MKKRWHRFAIIALILGGSMPASAANDVSQDNIIIVLDASGSMGRPMPGDGITKMEAAKRALKEVLAIAPETVNIGLLVFSGRNVRDDWVYPLSPRDDDRLRTAIDLPEPGGGTPLGDYIKKGADRLLEQREQQYGYGTYRLLIVTDGEAQDSDKVERYVSDVMSRGLTMDVIGVAMSRAHTLATKVHSYRSADDPESLKQAVAEVLAEVGESDDTAITEDLFADISPLPDELAMAVIDALSTSGNHPIGVDPGTLYRASPPSAQVSQKPIQPASPQASTNATGRLLVVVVLIVLLMMGFAIAMTARRKH